MSTAMFIPADPLDTSIHAGDFDGVLGALRGLSPVQRTQKMNALWEIDRHLRPVRFSMNKAPLPWWGMHVTPNHFEALDAALFFCGSDEVRAQMWRWNERFADALDLLEPAAIKSFVAKMYESRGWRNLLAHRLVFMGVVERPDSDEYILAIMSAPGWTTYRHDSVMRLIEADPGLVDGPLLRLFDVEGTADTNMSSFGKYTSGDNSWEGAFLELVRRGDLTRVTLLEKTLSTLERDWPQFRAGWFSRFHDLLAPTVDELLPLRERYLGLCHSRIPPTVTLALSALANLLKHDKLDAAPLMDALVPVISSSVKGQVDAALKMLDVLVKRSPALAHAASAIVHHALAHPASEVHKKVLNRIAAWGCAEDTRTALAAMVPHISASCRDALIALAGTSDAAHVHESADADMEKGLLSPLDPSRRLQAIEDLDDLVQAIAYVFENDHDIDEFERVLDALGRHSALVLGEAQRFSPVVKRALKVAGGEHPVAAALAKLLISIVGQLPVTGSDENVATGVDLRRRTRDLSVLMLQHAGLTPLSCATHRRGFIDPEMLVERLHAHQLAGVISSLHEQVRALLRLAPGGSALALTRARELAQTPLVQAFRYALGDDVAAGEERALFVAAARIRHPGADDTYLLSCYGDLGPNGPRVANYDWQFIEHHYSGGSYLKLELLVDPPPSEQCDPAFIAVCRDRFDDSWRYRDFWGGKESSLLYSASLVPGSLQSFFANGALEIGTNIDWWEARWQDKAYLAVLIDRATPVCQPAQRMLAFALGGKEPGQTAMAIDALVAVLLEGRSEMLPVAQFMRADLLSGHGKAARYAKSLGTAAGAHGRMPAHVCQALGTMLDIGDAPVPKDFGKLIELLLELALKFVVPVAPLTIASLQKLSLSGKAKTAQKELLARLAS
ncbi:MAG: DUF6493 family protein [Massilia sp.]